MLQPRLLRRLRTFAKYLTTVSLSRSIVGLVGDPGKTLREKTTVSWVLQCPGVMAKSVVMDPSSAVGFDIEQRMSLG